MLNWKSKMWDIVIICFIDLPFIEICLTSRYIRHEETLPLVKSANIFLLFLSCYASWAVMDLCLATSIVIPVLVPFEGLSHFVSFPGVLRKEVLFLPRFYRDKMHVTIMSDEQRDSFHFHVKLLLLIDLETFDKNQ